ncbi:MAG: P27 family phage terminase small subunit [Thermoguttaceae bacterium]
MAKNEVFMSGNQNSGRLRKPDELHKLTGTFRPDRHGKNNSLQVEVEPTKPRGMTKDEKWLWDSVIESLGGKGVLARIDTALLLSACELWGLYREALKAAKKNPVDKDARIAAVSYWQNFERAASRFGMDPASRARLSVDVKPNSNDPMFKLLTKMAANQNEKIKKI